MNCLVVGLGSIGSKHASILTALGHKVHVVDIKPTQGYNYYKTVEEAFKNQSFEYIIISNRTCDHYKTFIDIIKYDFKGFLLIEKPVFDRLYPLPDYNYDNVFVAYNLRFHPIINDIIQMLNGKNIFSIQVYVGQYLPEWRPDLNYRESYSASRNEGGGVLRDISHELDYINRITGGWKRVAAIGGNYGDLEIESDDVFGLLLESEKCPVVLMQVNYFDRKSRRELIINAEEISVKADLIQNTLELNSDCRQYEVQKEFTYIEQHKAIIAGDPGKLCTVGQAMDVLQLIESAEEAGKEKNWIIK